MQCLHQDTSLQAAAATQKEQLPQDTPPSGQLKVIASPPLSTANDSPAPSSSSKTYKLSLTNSSSPCQSQISQFGEALVQTFPWLANEPELMELAASCFLKDSDSFGSDVHLHSCLKTSMDYLAQTKVLPSRKSSKRLQVWGITAPGKLETATGTHLKTENGFSSWAITGEVKATTPKPSKKSLQELLSAEKEKQGSGGVREQGGLDSNLSSAPPPLCPLPSSFAILYRAGDGDRLYNEEAPTLRSPAKTGKHQGGSGAYKVREYQGETYYERPINATEAEGLMGWEIGSTATGIDVNGNEVQISQTQRIKMLGNGIIPGEVTDILLGLKPMLEQQQEANADANEELVIKEGDGCANPFGQRVLSNYFLRQGEYEVAQYPANLHKHPHFVDEQDLPNPDWAIMTGGTPLHVSHLQKRGVGKNEVCEKTSSTLLTNSPLPLPPTPDTQHPINSQQLPLRKRVSIERCDLKWAQNLVTEKHYLHRPIHARALPFAYAIKLDGEAVGTIIMSTIHFTKQKGLFGYEGLPTKWQVLQIARLWLDPKFQSKQENGHANCIASCAIAQMLKRVNKDWLEHHPPKFPDEPHDIELILAYADTGVGHQGTIYKAANFTKRGVTTNGRGRHATSKLSAATEKILYAYELNKQAREQGIGNKEENENHSLLTNSTLTRHHLDFYESPWWFTTELLRHVPLSGVIGEPCVGMRGIASLLKAWPHTKQLWTNDIDPNKQADYHHDATLSESWEHFPETDWIITNPPYADQAAPIIKNAFEKARVGVVAFLLTSFLEPCGDRAEFLKQHPPSLVLTFPRYCFRKDKAGKRWSTDNITISCFVWDKRATTQQLIPRPQSEIIGFYKNPDQAISLSEAKEIVKVIAESTPTPHLTMQSQSLTRANAKAETQIIDQHGGIGTIADNFGFGFTVHWCDGEEIAYNWERDSEIIKTFVISSQPTPEVKPMEFQFPEAEAFLGKVVEDIAAQIAQLQSRLTKYQECQTNANQLKEQVAAQAQLMMELEVSQQSITDWANRLYFLATGTDVAAMATKSVELAAKLTLLEQDNRALKYQLDNVSAEVEEVKQERDRLLNELESVLAESTSKSLQLTKELKSNQEERDRLLSRVEELEAQLQPKPKPEFTKGDACGNSAPFRVGERVNTIQGKGEITGFAYGNAIVKIGGNDYQFRTDQITKLDKFQVGDDVRVIKGQHKDKFAVIKEVKDQISCWVNGEFFFHFSSDELEIVIPDPALEPQRKAQEFVSKITKNTAWHQIKEVCQGSVEVWREVSLHARTKVQKSLIEQAPKLLADYIQQTGDRSDLEWVGDTLRAKVEELLDPKQTTDGTPPILEKLPA